MALPSPNNTTGLPPMKFYGCSKSLINKSEKNETIKESVKVTLSSGLCLDNKLSTLKLNRLSGPSQTWKVFKKQNDALLCAKMRKNGLMPFAFQQSTGERLFLVAHPRVFWYHDCKRLPEQRCTYEIIPEYSVCKLYFDLEYEITYNPNLKGDEMVETFILIVCYYINKVWGIECSRQDVLDLDSTTDFKFSRHLIFQLPSAVFKNNLHVGNFVKHICNEIRSMCNLSATNTEKSRHNKQCGCIQKPTDIEPFANVSDLIIRVKDNKLKLFCDEAVYSKNRHFRIFQSTKQGKKSPLLLSKQNIFTPCSPTDYSTDESIFLSSLITYVTTESVADIRLIEYCSCPNLTFNNKIKSTASPSEIISNSEEQTSSPYPFIDTFIEKLVSPGRIWRNAYFKTTDVIVYDIVGNRYCGNIGREHRSNNIKYVVDIKHLCYYQKCYDSDCYKYRSLERKLPPELCFMLEDDSYFNDNISLTNVQGEFDPNISEEDLLEVLNVVEDVSILDFQNNDF